MVARWIVVAGFLTSVQAHAAPITFNEGASGDLPDSGPPTHVGTVDVGANTVSGTATFVATIAGSVINHDAFAFDVPAGLALTDILFDWVLTPIEGPIGELFSADIDYTLASPSGSSEVDIHLFDGGGTSTGSLRAFAPLLPAREGSYEVTTTGDGASGSAGPGEQLGWSLAYIWTLSAVLVGSTPLVPILPDATTDKGYVFQDAASGLWYDPPFVTSYTYLAGPGTLFTGVQFPTGFGGAFVLSSPECSFGSAFGTAFIDLSILCGHGLSEFTVSGLSPAADAGDPLGFPTFLTFNNPSGDFTMNGNAVPGGDVVPEPSSLLLLATGLGVGSYRRWRRILSDL
jgi:hypothetical protein